MKPDCLVATALLLAGFGSAVAAEPSPKDQDFADAIATLLPHSKQQPGNWRYTFQQPGSGWFTPEFDDSEWKSGPGGFGTRETPNTRVGTVWKTKEIWLRRSFTIDQPLKDEVYVELHHDEDTTVYLNGVRAVEVTWYTGSRGLPEA